MRGRGAPVTYQSYMAYFHSEERVAHIKPWDRPPSRIGRLEWYAKYTKLPYKHLYETVPSFDIIHIPLHLPYTLPSFSFLYPPLSPYRSSNLPLPPSAKKYFNVLGISILFWSAGPRPPRWP